MPTFLLELTRTEVPPPSGDGIEPRQARPLPTFFFNS